MLFSLVLCSILVIFTRNQVSCQAVDTHGPPKVDRNPLYLDSFIPASMQIIAHLTELMKYEVNPPKVTTTTTQAPTTLAHRPGVFAPHKPPHPTTHYDRTSTYIKLGEDKDDVLHFNRYHNKHSNPNGKFTYGWSLLGGQKSSIAQEFEAKNDDLDLLGKIPNDLYKLLNTIEDYDSQAPVDEDTQVLRFSEKYDDNDVRYLLRQKKVPPTRAYVTLLSLYDNLNKESKALGLNKYSGYTKEVLRHLSETSTGTSANQLRFVLSKIVERRDTKAPDITKKINQLIDDLNQSDSYLNDALRYIPPLVYDF